jgi:methylmalonyl-CoA mutase
LEDLTHKLCAVAWSLFQEIERACGAAAALEEGLIQQKVAAIRSKLNAAVANRSDILTGTSEFPSIHETPVSVLDVAPLSPPAPARAADYEPLLPIRLAEPFEQLRDASDRVLSMTGVRPKVFLANLGRPSDFMGRATFAKNFFEAGGIEAVQPASASNSPEDLAAAFGTSGATLACLCSSDDVYVREAADTARALKAAGATHLYLAGRPRDPSLFKAAGIETFIFSRCDALAVLAGAHDMIHGSFGSVRNRPLS